VTICHQAQPQRLTNDLMQETKTQTVDENCNPFSLLTGQRANGTFIHVGVEKQTCKYRDRETEETMATDSWITTLQVATGRIRLDERIRQRLVLTSIRVMRRMNSGGGQHV